MNRMAILPPNVHQPGDVLVQGGHGGGYLVIAPSGDGNALVEIGILKGRERGHFVGVVLTPDELEAQATLALRLADALRRGDA